jgi:SAM-dependent methyltransferase
MRQLPFQGTFDAACCLLHTVNYMVIDDDLAAALGSVAAALRPRGVALVDFIAYEPRSEWKAAWRETITARNVRIVCEHDQAPDWRAMVATDRHTYTVMEGERTWSASGTDRLRITSAREMCAFAREAGLEVLRVCRKYDLAAEPGADGGVLIARRP